MTLALFSLSHHLWMIIIGVGLLTFGFFGDHSIASSSVGLIAHRNKAQASSLYLFFYYFRIKSQWNDKGFILYSI